MPSQKPGRISGLVSIFYRNWVTLAGFVLAVAAAFAFVLLFAIELFAEGGNQYMGILAYIVAPAFFFMGMGLVAIGWWMHRRQLARASGGVLPALSVSIDLSRSDHRRQLFLFLSGATVFLLLTAFGSYKTYHYTESTEFCGRMCHTVMEPEYVTYQHSPHARVACVECHIGSGATWYVKSKLSGAYQVYSVIAKKYEQPIPTPVRNLRPAQDTCEQCHWPEKFSGDLVKTYQHFLADDENTSYTVRVALRVGGGNPANGPVGGIHWHASKSHKVEYIATDERRQTIPWVRVTDEQGNVKVYATEKYRETPPPGEIRRMDCMDCHNRPAHTYKSPNYLVEQAMALGRVDMTLPAFKPNAVTALTAEYADVPAAMAGIEASLRAAYPDRPTIEAAIGEVQKIYRENFFPYMRARWDKYPENIGHKDWPGCFRCHDGEHKTIDVKETIKANDCNACHLFLAQGSGEQLHKVEAFGMPFEHPGGGDVEGTSCTDCHNGANQ